MDRTCWGCRPEEAWAFERRTGKTVAFISHCTCGPERSHSPPFRPVSPSYAPTPKPSPGAWWLNLEQNSILMRVNGDGIVSCVDAQEVKQLWEGSAGTARWMLQVQDASVNNRPAFVRIDVDVASLAVTKAANCGCNDALVSVRRYVVLG